MFKTPPTTPHIDIDIDILIPKKKSSTKSKGLYREQSKVTKDTRDTHNN